MVYNMQILLFHTALNKGIIIVVLNQKKIPREEKMEAIIIIFLVIIVAIIVAVSMAVGKLKTRASNHIRGKIGIDDSNIYGTVFEGGVNSLAVKKLYKSHPEYSEESIKQLSVNIVNGIINNTIPGQGDKFQDKIRNNRMFQEHMPNCSLRRVNIMSYNDKKDVYTAVVTYADKKDDYVFNISVGFTQQGPQLQYAAFSKGHANGF